MRLVSRIASLAVAALYGVLYFRQLPPSQKTDPHELLSLLILLFPLALIWFSETVASATGYIGHGARVSVETPPWMVEAAGWFFLIGLPVLLWVLSK